MSDNTLLYRIILNVYSLDGGTAENWFLESDVDEEYLIDAFGLCYYDLDHLQKQNAPCDLPMIVLLAVKMEVYQQFHFTENEDFIDLANDLNDKIWVHGNYLCSFYDGIDLPEFVDRFNSLSQKHDLEPSTQMEFLLNKLQ